MQQQHPQLREIKVNDKKDAAALQIQVNNIYASLTRTNKQIRTLLFCFVYFKRMSELEDGKKGPIEEMVFPPEYESKLAVLLRRIEIQQIQADEQVRTLLKRTQS